MRTLVTASSVPNENLILFGIVHLTFCSATEPVNQLLPSLGQDKRIWDLVLEKNTLWKECKQKEFIECQLDDKT